MVRKITNKVENGTRGQGGNGRGQNENRLVVRGGITLNLERPYVRQMGKFRHNFNYFFPRKPLQELLL